MGMDEILKPMRDKQPPSGVKNTGKVEDSYCNGEVPAVPKVLPKSEY